MNRTYIESYYERYKDADFVADFIKDEMKLGYEWLKSSPDREKIVEDIVNFRVNFVKDLKIMNLDEKNRPKIRAWQWIMIEYRAIVNYITSGKCNLAVLSMKKSLNYLSELPVFEDFKGGFECKETYLSSVLTRHQWLASSYLDPNVIVKVVE